MRTSTTPVGPGPECSGGARRLYLIRHGEAAPVAQEGQAADPWQAVLTDRGRAQIMELAEALRGCRLDRLVASAVPRAIETARLLAGPTGLRPSVEPGWNELRGGRVLAGSAEQVRRSIRDALQAAGQPGARFLGGESFGSFAARVEQALAGLLAEPGWTRAAVVTHEPAIGHLLARCHGLPLGGLTRFALSPGTASVLDWPMGGVGLDAATVRLLNGLAADLRGLR